jgi:hypothetical protein
LEFKVSDNVVLSFLGILARCRGTSKTRPMRKQRAPATTEEGIGPRKNRKKKCSRAKTITYKVIGKPTKRQTIVA